MSVPDPLSAACETRDCGICDGTAYDHLKDAPGPCTCRCHGPGR